MTKLSADASYKYFHGITCFAPASNRGMATAQQFLDHIVAQLAVYSCYEYFQLIAALDRPLLRHPCRTIILYGFAFPQRAYTSQRFPYIRS